MSNFLLNRLYTVNTILAASDTDLIIGSVVPVDNVEADPDDLPDAEIHREDPLPPGKRATIRIGDKTSETTELTEDTRELRACIIELVGAQQYNYLMSLPTNERLANIRLAAVNRFANDFDFAADLAINEGMIGQESIGAFFRGIGNVVSHFAGIFTTYVTRGFADFKRSELAEFKQSNRFDVGYAAQRMFKQDSDKILLPLPVEIKVTRIYDTYKMIEPFLLRASIKARASVMIGFLERILRDPETPVQIPTDVDAGIIEIGEKAVNQIYIKNDVKTATPTQIYGSPSGFNTTVDTLIKADGFLYTVSDTHERLKKLDEVISKMDGMQMNPYQAKALAVYFKSFARLVTTYGQCITILNVLQHYVTSHLLLINKELDK